MNHKSAVCLSCVFLVAAVAAAAQNVGVRPSRRALTPEQLAASSAARMRHNGGIVEIPGKGNLAVINAQKTVEISAIDECVKELTQFSRGISIRVVEDSFSLGTAQVVGAKHGASSVFLVDDPSLPLSLIALEEGWGLMNVAKLKEGNPPAEKLKQRCRKEFVRISSVVFSGAKSDYLTSPLQTVRSAAALDKVPGEAYGFDMLPTMMSHLSDLGVTPARTLTYRSACQQGLAPEPTNEIQKAVWDDVRKMPTRPIKVEFNGVKK